MTAINFNSLLPLVPAKSREEEFVEVLERINTNARYRCRFCGHVFSGGNQKIRVHITGVKEGGSSVRACTNPSADAVEFCIQPRKSYKRGIAQDESTKVKKIPKLQATHLASIYTEAWNLLHAPGKLRDTEAGSSGDIADGMVNTPSVPATTDRSFHIVQQLLDEYGVEKAEDLGHLDNVYLIKIAGYLKVVPRKIFLEMLGVPVPPATGTV